MVREWIGPSYAGINCLAAVQSNCLPFSFRTDNTFVIYTTRARSTPNDPVAKSAHSHRAIIPPLVAISTHNDHHQCYLLGSHPIPSTRPSFTHHRLCQANDIPPQDPLAPPLTQSLYRPHLTFCRSSTTRSTLDKRRTAMTIDCTSVPSLPSHLPGLTTNRFRSCVPLSFNSENATLRQLKGELTDGLPRTCTTTDKQRPFRQ